MSVAFEAPFNMYGAFKNCGTTPVDVPLGKTPYFTPHELSRVKFDTNATVRAATLQSIRDIYGTSAITGDATLTANDDGTYTVSGTGYCEFEVDLPLQSNAYSVIVDVRGMLPDDKVSFGHVDIVNVSSGTVLDTFDVPELATSMLEAGVKAFRRTTTRALIRIYATRGNDAEYSFTFNNLYVNVANTTYEYCEYSAGNGYTVTDGAIKDSAGNEYPDGITVPAGCCVAVSFGGHIDVRRTGQRGAELPCGVYNVCVDGKTYMTLDTRIGVSTGAYYVLDSKSYPVRCISEVNERMFSIVPQALIDNEWVNLSTIVDDYTITYQCIAEF